MENWTWQSWVRFSCCKRLFSYGLRSMPAGELARRCSMHRRCSHPCVHTFADNAGTKNNILSRSIVKLMTQSSLPCLNWKVKSGRTTLTRYLHKSSSSPFCSWLSWCICPEPLQTLAASKQSRLKWRKDVYRSCKIICILICLISIDFASVKLEFLNEFKKPIILLKASKIDWSKAKFLNNKNGKWISTWRLSNGVTCESSLEAFMYLIWIETFVRST